MITNYIDWVKRQPKQYHEFLLSFKWVDPTSPNGKATNISKDWRKCVLNNAERSLRITDKLERNLDATLSRGNSVLLLAYLWYEDALKHKDVNRVNELENYMLKLVSTSMTYGDTPDDSVMNLIPYPFRNKLKYARLSKISSWKYISPEDILEATEDYDNIPWHLYGSTMGLTNWYNFFVECEPVALFYLARNHTNQFLTALVYDREQYPMLKVAFDMCFWLDITDDPREPSKTAYTDIEKGTIVKQLLDMASTEHSIHHKALDTFLELIASVDTTWLQYLGQYCVNAPGLVTEISRAKVIENHLPTKKKKYAAQIYKMLNIAKCCLTKTQSVTKAKQLKEYSALLELYNYDFTAICPTLFPDDETFNRDVYKI